MIILATACNETEPTNNVQLVDPNVATPDTNAVIDRDNPYDSSYSVALDSQAATITAADTVR